MQQPHYGAYGLVISGFDSPRLGHLLPSNGHLPLHLTAGQAKDAIRDVPEEESDERVVLREDGRLTVHLDRRARTAQLFDDDPERIIHPLLSFAGAFFATWDGRLALHAGAFVHDDRAWIVAASNLGGKSTLLARLALDGHAVLADDVTVVTDSSAFVGPRCLDVRPEAAALLGISSTTPQVRGGRAHRVPLGPAPAIAPLGGMVSLEWGEGPLAIDRVPLERRVALICESQVLYVPTSDASAVLDLAALPMWRVTRPRGSSPEATARDLLAHLGRS